MAVIVTENTLVFRGSVRIPDDKIISNLHKVQTGETRKERITEEKVTFGESLS